jgi:hypothetical protein
MFRSIIHLKLILAYGIKYSLKLFMFHEWFIERTAISLLNNCGIFVKSPIDHLIIGLLLDFQVSFIANTQETTLYF